METNAYGMTTPKDHKAANEAWFLICVVVLSTRSVTGLAFSKILQLIF